MSKKIADLRRDYVRNSLNINELEKNPIAQFKKWFAEALAEKSIIEPNAMVLSTVSADGRPSSRVVLLKEIAADGFVFFTNYESRKGAEIAENGFAAINFWWPPLEKQVRIEGFAKKISASESEKYFQSRPKKSQIGAWASPQSRKIERENLEKNVENLEIRYKNDEKLPLPPFWGGYKILPDRVEFWQGRRSRLHDRLVFSKINDENWDIFRLAP